jgi:hypothetical protein
VANEFKKFNFEYKEIAMMFKNEFNYVREPGLYPSDLNDAIDGYSADETAKLFGKLKNNTHKYMYTINIILI